MNPPIGNKRVRIDDGDTVRRFPAHVRAGNELLKKSMLFGDVAIPVIRGNRPSRWKV